MTCLRLDVYSSVGERWSLLLVATVLSAQVLGGGLACDTGLIDSSQHRDADRCDGAADGTIQTRIRYETGSVPYGQACEVETQTRTCENRTWSAWTGTYTFEACVVESPSDCGSVAEGGIEARPCYDAASVPAEATCTFTTQTRTCHNGIFDPDWPSCSYLSCTVEGYANCGSVSHGNTELRLCYESDAVPFGSSCVVSTQTRTCSDGLWSPDWPPCDHLSCRVLPNAPAFAGATSPQPVNNAASTTLSWTPPEGENRYLVVSIGGSNNVLATSVLWGGTALTKLVEESGWPSVQQWGLKSPASGMHDLVVTFPGNAYAVVLARVFNGVDQTTPVGPSAHAHGSEMTSRKGAVAVSSESTDLVVDVVGTDSSTGSHVPALGQMLDAQAEAPDLEWISFSHAAGATNMSWSWPNDASAHPGWSIAATPLKLASGTPSSTKEITSFVFQEYPSDPGAIGADAISVMLPVGADVTALTPVVTHTGVSLSPPPSVSRSFAEPVIFTVTAADSSIRSYTVTVSLETASGTTYYVSSSDGSDGNTGTSSGAPLKTVAGVNAADIQPGDHVLFKRGDIWREQTTLHPAAGTSSGYVTYGAYGTGTVKPRLLGSTIKNSTSDWTEVSPNHWWSTDASFNVSVGNLIFGDETGFGVKKFSAGDLMAQGDYYWNDSDGSVSLYSTENPATYYTQIECALDLPIILLGSGQDFVIFENLDLRYTAGHGLSAYSGCTNIIIRSCDFSWIGGGDFTDSTGAVRYGNAIQFWQSSSDILIERCTFDQIYDAAITPQYSGSGATVITNWTARYNIVRRSEYSFEMFTDSPSGSISGVYVNNNTFVDAGDGFGHDQRPDMKNGRHIMIWVLSVPTSSFFVRNNIFSQASESAVWVNSADIPEIDFDYNDYDVSVVGFNGGSTYTSLSAWRSYTGQEAHSISASPAFVSQGDYHLSSSSPCINAGVDVGYTSDFDGASISGNPDIGAFEYAP